MLAFLETGAFVGLVFPGETAVILGGAVAGQGETNVIITIAIVWFCAWAGDTTSFFIGRRLGRDFVMRHGPKVRITHERFEQVEDFFQRHGGKTILIGRFIGLVRALAPFIAGSSGMQYRAFVPFSVIGTGLWAAAFTLLGYALSSSLDKAAEYAGTGTLIFGAVVALVVGVRRREALPAQAREPGAAGGADRGGAGGGAAAAADQVLLAADHAGQPRARADEPDRDRSRSRCSCSSATR